MSSLLLLAFKILFLLPQVDLVGGYYDSGDNVKFGLPMAFSTTVLSWSVLEFGNRVPSEQNAAVEAIRWATDYLLKACSKLPNALYVQVAIRNMPIFYCWKISFSARNDSI